MSASASWRMFRRMQVSLALAAALIYAACALSAWRTLPGGADLKLQRTLLFPGAFFLISAAAFLLVPLLRRAVRRHLWTSYLTGFGQSVISVLGGVLTPIAAAGLILWQVHRAAAGGPYPGGAFSGYGAGLGLLLAQAILVRGLSAPESDRGRADRGHDP